MTYGEFRESYGWLVKNYPATSNLYNRDDVEITVEIVNYEKRGSRWREVERKTESADWRYYCNVFDAVPWFRNLGGRETVSCGYTRVGYIPYEVSSISPDKMNKTVRHFRVV